MKSIIHHHCFECDKIIQLKKDKNYDPCQLCDKCKGRTK
jgi:hypothetical protein